jgi:hypothetical protein
MSILGLDFDLGETDLISASSWPETASLLILHAKPGYPTVDVSWSMLLVQYSDTKSITMAKTLAACKRLNSKWA